MDQEMDQQMDQQMDQEFSEFLRQGALISDPGGGLHLGWGFLGSFAHPKQARAQGAQAIFYAPDFFLREPLPWLGFRFHQKVELSEFRDRLQGAGARATKGQERQGAGSPWQEPELSGFAQDFARAKAMIAEQQASKLVPITFARRSHCPTVEERRAWLLNLSSQLGPAWLYGFWLDAPANEGLLGLTPELLLSLEPKGQLQTMALAGTERPQGPSLLTDPKQWAEHQWVVRDICERLGGASQVRELESGQTYEWQMPQIKHLRTDIRAELKESFWEEDKGFQSLVELLHPTAALGSFPREALTPWTEQASTEQLDRGRFGAPFGFYQGPESGPSWAVVAIRNVQWADGVLRLGSGCGVVEESQLEGEWQELALKRSVVLRGLNNEC